MLEQNIDYLVLGCSHYPYLIPQLRKIIPTNVKIIDSGEAVAKQTQHILNQYKLTNSSKEQSYQHFYTNSDSKVLKTILKNDSTVFEKNF